MARPRPPSWCPWARTCGGCATYRAATRPRETGAGRKGSSKVATSNAINLNDAAIVGLPVRRLAPKIGHDTFVSGGLGIAIVACECNTGALTRPTAWLLGRRRRREHLTGLAFGQLLHLGTATAREETCHYERSNNYKSHLAISYHCRIYGFCMIAHAFCHVNPPPRVWAVRHDWPWRPTWPPLGLLRISGPPLELLDYGAPRG